MVASTEGAKVPRQAGTLEIVLQLSPRFSSWDGGSFEYAGSPNTDQGWKNWVQDYCAMVVVSWILGREDFVNGNGPKALNFGWILAWNSLVGSSEGDGAKEQYVLWTERCLRSHALL